MTVQTLRSPGASTIVTNTVAGVPTLPAKFYATMGEPHTFTDPITSETITVVSDATAVDFAGHVDTGQLIIDAIAPGYVDTRGSHVGDIVILRPITGWADNLYNILSESHNDDGTIKNDAITTEAQFTDNVDPVKRQGEVMFDFIVLGGCVLTGTGYGSTLAWSLTAGVVYIGGKRLTVAAATGTVTASKDTYFDLLDPGTGTVATLVNTAGNIVTNNATSPALAANSVRLGIIVSGATNILNVGSINQGQIGKLLPIASSIPYMKTDSIGNLICPRDPNRKVLGYREIRSNVISTTASGSGTDMTGLNLNYITPLGREVEITGFIGQGSASIANNAVGMELYDVTAGAIIASSSAPTNASGDAASVAPCVPVSTAGTRNIKARLYRGSNAATANGNASATNPNYIIVKLA